MSYRLVGCSALFVLLFCSASTAQAKAWTQPSDQAYVNLSLRSIIGTNAYMSDGSIEPSGTYSDLSLRRYTEYGLADNWTLVTHGTPAGWANYNGRSTFYVGPIFGGIRRSIIDTPLQVAVEAYYGYAPGFGEKNLALDEAAVSYIPAMKTHAAGGELQAGYDFDWGWMVASAGMRWHSRDNIDTAAVGFAQVGFNATYSIELAAYLSLYEPIGDVDTTNVSGVGQTRFLGFGVNATWWRWERFGFSVEAAGVAYAESNAATPAFALGVQWKI